MKIVESDSTYRRKLFDSRLSRLPPRLCENRNYTTQTNMTIYQSLPFWGNSLAPPMRSATLRKSYKTKAVSPQILPSCMAHEGTEMLEPLNCSILKLDGSASHAIETQNTRLTSSGENTIESRSTWPRNPTTGYGLTGCNEYLHLNGEVHIGETAKGANNLNVRYPDLFKCFSACSLHRRFSCIGHPARKRNLVAVSSQC
jgi:hypothetical protein